MDPTRFVVLALAAGWTTAAYAGHDANPCKEDAQNAVNRFRTLFS